MGGIRDARFFLAIAVLVLVIAILAIVGLRRLAPPRMQAGGSDDFFTHLHTERAMANVTVFPGRAGPVTITIQLETPDERPLAATAVSVTLSQPDSAVEPATVQAQRTDDGRWRAKMTASVAGRWTLGLGILVADSDKISVEAPILIK
jgi:copper transport protein